MRQGLQRPIQSPFKLALPFGRSEKQPLIRPKTESGNSIARNDAADCRRKLERQRGSCCMRNRLAATQHKTTGRTCSFNGHIRKGGHWRS